MPYVFVLKKFSDRKAKKKTYETLFGSTLFFLHGSENKSCFNVMKLKLAHYILFVTTNRVGLYVCR